MQSNKYLAEIDKNINTKRISTKRRDEAERFSTVFFKRILPNLLTRGEVLNCFIALMHRLRGSVLLWSSVLYNGKLIDFELVREDSEQLCI